jgi:hypothetical protein
VIRRAAKPSEIDDERQTSDRLGGWNPDLYRRWKAGLTYSF